MAAIHFKSPCTTVTALERCDYCVSSLATNNSHNHRGTITIHFLMSTWRVWHTSECGHCDCQRVHHVRSCLQVLVIDAATIELLHDQQYLGRPIEPTIISSIEQQQSGASFYPRLPIHVALLIFSSALQKYLHRQSQLQLHQRYMKPKHKQASSIEPQAACVTP